MNILDAVSRIGLVLKKVSVSKGGEYAGPCPKCGGTDRFRVWPADKGGGGSYWCRQSGNGCGAWGDLVQFLVDFCGYQYREAFKEAGREMPDNYVPAGNRPAMTRPDPVFEPRVFEDPVETWRIKAQELVETSHQAILENEEVLKYLDKRGVDLSAVKGFRLGWFLGEKGKHCKYRPRESWGLPTVIKESNGRKKMLWIPRGLVIPCFKGGLIYRIRIRRPAEDLTPEMNSKYYILPGSGMEAMGTNPDRKAFVVVESELDGILITRKAGSIAGVIALGSAQNKPGSGVFYQLKKSLRVLVALDYDKPGQKAWGWWRKNFDNAKFWPVPEGKDPGEAYEKGIDIKEWVTDGLPPVLTMNYNRAYKIPEGVYPIEELKMLLSKYSIKIKAELDHAEILFDPGFKNRQIRQRVKDLFFGDEEVHWYLRTYHPASIIHGGNCEVQKIS